MTTLATKPDASSQNRNDRSNSDRPKSTLRKQSSFAKKYGPWAVVTGASAGIGQEFARQLAAQGLNLILVARREEKLRDLADELEQKHNTETQVVAVDLASADALRVIEQATEKIDIGLVINNAGVENHGSFLDLSIDAEAQLLQLNVVALMRLSHYFGRRLQSRGQGGIILVSSAAGYGAWPYLSNYAASKSYVLTFGESLHYELAKHGVDVTVLSPGLTETAMADSIGTGVDFSKFPMRVMQPSDVVRSGLKALGRKASVIPGAWNNVLLFAGKRILSRRGVMKMFGGLMDKARKG